MEKPWQDSIMVTRPPHKSIEESLEIIRTVFSGDGMWAVELKETSEAIGCIGYLPAECSNLDIEEDQCEVGYWKSSPMSNPRDWHRQTCESNEAELCTG